MPSFSWLILLRRSLLGECHGGKPFPPKREQVPGATSSRQGCSWPPHPGEYIVGNPAASVAICTLSSRELPPKLIAAGRVRFSDCTSMRHRKHRWFFRYFSWLGQILCNTMCCQSTA